MTTPAGTVYVDSSLAVHVLERTPAAVDWWAARVDDATYLIASGLLALEVARYLGRLGADACAGDAATGSVTALPIDDALLVEATTVPPPLTSLDSLHLATAARVGTDRVVIATHDRAFTRAAHAMGFETVDPLT